MNTRRAARSPRAEDPFGEHAPVRMRARFSVLGCDVRLTSADSELLRLADDAFRGLPGHRLSSRPRRLDVCLVRTSHKQTWPRRSEPPRPILSSGNGLLSATIDAGNHAVVDVAMSRALVCLSPALLKNAYHARYELIELAVVTLASRALSLVPLHAACVGTRGAGLLLMGGSGSGKSTLGLHALTSGMQLLSEDSAFATVEDLRVTGIPNFLHLHESAVEQLEPGPLLRRIRRAPTIQRRSGVRKLEVDLRDLGHQAPRLPLRLEALIFLSKRSCGRQPPLKRIARKLVPNQLRREQPYASGMSNWQEFEHRIAHIPAFELRRAAHPDIAIRHLRALLD